mgnify:FL=1
MTDIYQWSLFEADMLGLPSYAADFVLDNCPLWAHLGYSGEEPFAASDWEERVCRNAAVEAFEAKERAFREWMRANLPTDTKPSDLYSVSEIANKMYGPESVRGQEMKEHPLFSLMALGQRYEVVGK